MTPPPDSSDPRDYILELSGMENAPAAPSSETRNSKIENPPLAFLSIHFKCCNVYAPIYKNKTSTAYAGHCPRCQRPASIPISPTGTRARIFQAE
jgi:hypothetical protein